MHSVGDDESSKAIIRTVLNKRSYGPRSRLQLPSITRLDPSIMKLLQDLTRKYRKLDDEFFYWWKAQSPVEIDALFLKLKLSLLAFVCLSVTFVSVHNRSLSRAEDAARAINEKQLVIIRKQKRAERLKSAGQRQRKVVTKPIMTIHH